MLGKRERKPAAAARFAENANVSAVRLNDAARDSKPESCAAGRTAARLFAAIKALEDMWEVLGSNSLAAIGNSHFHAHAGTARLNLDFTPGRRVRLWH